MRLWGTRLLAAWLAAVAIAGFGVASAAADVVYSDAYRVALGEYAEFEFKPGDWAWSGRRGVYEHDPRSAPWGGFWTDTIAFVYLAPDGTLGDNDWVEDESTPNGWSYVDNDDLEGF